MKEWQNVVEIVHNNVQKVLINSLHSNFWKKFIKMWFFSPKNPYPALKAGWKQFSVINLQSVSVLKVFSILRCQSNVSKKIVGKIAVYGSSLSVVGSCK